MNSGGFFWGFFSGKRSTVEEKGAAPTVGLDRESGSKE